MVTSWRALALLVALLALGAPARGARSTDTVYHNQFAVHVPAGLEHVDDIARRHGYVNHGQVRWFEQQREKRRVKRDYSAY